MDIDQINIEIGVFLKRLRMYSNQNNIQINDKTTELLQDVIVNVDKLMTNAEMLPQTGDDVNFIFDLDEQQFDVRQYIMCRVCVEQIGMSKNDLSAHLQRNAKVHKPQTSDSDLNKIKIHYELESDENFTENKSECDSILSDDNHWRVIDSVSADDFATADDFLVGDQLEDAGSTNVPSIPFNRDSTWLIQVTSFPWTATKDEIVKFFDDVNILNGVNGIHFVVNETKNRKNQAFIQLESEKDFQLAEKRKMNSARCLMLNYLDISLQPSIPEFLQLINKPTYPFEQRILRLEKLPSQCKSEDIEQYFYGRSILNIHFVLDKARQPCNEAFVVFENSTEVELALRNGEGKRIRGMYIKMYRSSEEQYRYYCKNPPNIQPTVLNQWPNGLSHSNSVPNLGPKKRKFCGSTMSLKRFKKALKVCVCGIPLNAQKTDVVSFFQGVKVVGGAHNIEVKRMVEGAALEATFVVNSPDDLKKALSRNKTRFGFNTVYVFQM